jgi:glycosyltransferase involved in cell wall biosynthesis
VDATDYHLSPRIFAEIARHRPQAVITAGFSVPSAYALAYTALTGAGLVLHSDGTSASEADFSAAQMFARRVLLTARPVCVANSRASADRFTELGVPASRLFSAPHTTGLRPYWGVARRRRYDHEGPIRVISVGRLTAAKGNDQLLRAIAAARAEVPALAMRMIGSGPEEHALRRLAASLDLDVEFKGFVDQPDLPDMYADADIFAFPTQGETFGIVLLEAAAAGLALVASAKGGATRDLVADGESGLVVNPDDIGGMARAFVRLATDADLRRRLGSAAYRLTLDRGPEDVAGAYLAAASASVHQRTTSLVGRLRSRGQR